MKNSRRFGDIYSGMPQKIQLYSAKHVLLFFRACSYDPVCRDVSPSRTDTSMRSYGVFHPACPDEILLLALACTFQSRDTIIFSDYGVFLYSFASFARKSIALQTYLTLYTVLR